MSATLDPPSLLARLARRDALASRTQAMLAAHVPLSLLMDLADPAGPQSLDLLTAEPGQADWLNG